MKEIPYFSEILNSLSRESQIPILNGKYGLFKIDIFKSKVLLELGN